MKSLLLLVFIVPAIAVAQSDSSYHGIRFQQDLTWQQIREKAKAENKYIFADCYATWCVPCKEMEQRVYPLEKIGQFANDKYVSVKIQVDTNTHDNKQTINRYGDAHNMSKEFKIESLPTYLIFSPEGEIVNKAVGFYDPEMFLEFLLSSMNPDKQYYNLLKKFKDGKLEYTEMPDLAQRANLLRDPKEAEDIAKKYIDNYFVRLTEDKIYTPTNIKFIAQFTKDTKGQGFKIFYKHEAKINKMVNTTDYAQDIVAMFISNEEILPVLLKCMKTGDTPDWKAMEINITSKFDEYYGRRTVASQKYLWYNYKKDWVNYTRNLVDYMNDYGAGVYFLYQNNFAWDIFKYSNNKKELTTAITWVQRAMKLDSTNEHCDFIDTYANLLYKLGEVKEAILWEDKAVQIIQRTHEDDSRTEDIIQNDAKMKSGVPTWEVN